MERAQGGESSKADALAGSDTMTVPQTMKAWVLGDPEELILTEKPVPTPAKAEALVRIDAVAICATDLEIIKYGTPALIEGGTAVQQELHPRSRIYGNDCRTRTWC